MAARGAHAPRQAIALSQYYAVKSLQGRRVGRPLAKYEPADSVAFGRQIARHVLSAGRYSL